MARLEDSYEQGLRHYIRGGCQSPVSFGSGFATTEGNHLVPTGSIGKVRTVKADDNVTFMVIDFKVKNDSDQVMVVHSVETAIDSATGETIMGGGVASADVKSAFRNYPLLGEQYNPILKERDTIPAPVGRSHGRSPFRRPLKRESASV